MNFENGLLVDRIKDVFGCQGNFAIAMKLSERTVSKKLNGKVDWKTSEVENAIKILNLPRNSIPKYFFTPKVQKSELQREQEST